MKSIKFNEITSSIIFDDLKSSWNDLLLKQSHLSFFLSWEWLNTWWHTYANDTDKLFILLFEENNEVIGIVPLYIQNNEVIRFIGTGESEAEEVSSEYLDVICSIDNTNSIVKLLSTALTVKLNTVVKLEFNNYLINSAIHETIIQLKSQHWHHITLSGIRYQASLKEGFTHYKQSCSKSLIKKLLRHKNKFTSSLNGLLIPYHTQHKYVEGLNLLASLHSNRWQKKNLDGAFTSNTFFEFHYQFCQLALKNNWLNIYTLESNENNIAAIYNINFQETCYFYQMGIDTDFKPNLSPGYLIHLLLIEQSINNKLHFYDFMKGTEQASYKSNLSDVRTKMFNAVLLKKNQPNFLKMLILRKKKLKGLIKKWYDRFQNR